MVATLQINDVCRSLDQPYCLLKKKEFKDIEGADRTLCLKTDKTMPNKMKRNTNIEHTALTEN